MNDGSVINGYCENLFKHDRPTIKVSPGPDGKKAVKYKAIDIRELKYEIPNDTVVEYLVSGTVFNRTLLMTKVRECGTVTLWTACIGGQELIDPHGMRWTERIKYCISFGHDMADGIAWDFPHIIHGRCKQLPGYGDFVSQYKKSHPEIKDWTEFDLLMEMCAAYVESVK